MAIVVEGGLPRIATQSMNGRMIQATAIWNIIERYSFFYFAIRIAQIVTFSRR